MKTGKRNKEWQRGNTSTSMHVKNRGTGSSCEVTKEIETLFRHPIPTSPSHPPFHPITLFSWKLSGRAALILFNRWPITSRGLEVFCSSRNWRSVPLWDKFGVSHLGWGKDHVCQGHCFNSSRLPAAIPPFYRIWSPNHSSDLGAALGLHASFSHFFQGFKFNLYDYLIFSLSLLSLSGFVCLFVSFSWLWVFLYLSLMTVSYCSAGLVAH